MEFSKDDVTQIVDNALIQKDIKQLGKDINGMGERFEKSIEIVEKNHNHSIQRIWERIELMQQNFDKQNKTIIEINNDIKKLLQDSSSVDENKKMLLTAIISVFGGVVMAWVVSLLQIGS